MRATKMGANTVGTRYAIVEKTPGRFLVYRECANYAGHLPGGIAKTWRVVNEKMTLAEIAKGMTLAEAETLFAKRLAGKVR